MAQESPEHLVTALPANGGQAEANVEKSPAGSISDKEAVDNKGTLPADTPEPEVRSVHTWDAPWHMKWLSFLAIMSLRVGLEWTDSSLSPLKATLRKTLKINNTQYGVIASANNLVNCFWPVLGGVILDWFGVEIVAPVCTGMILVGSFVIAGGMRNLDWHTVVGGYILQGFGSAWLDGCQNVFFHAIGGRRGLGLPFGLENAVSLAIAAASQAAAVPIYENLGLEWVYWIGVFFCIFSFGINLVYVWYARTVIPKEFRIVPGRKGSTRKFSFQSLWSLPWTFWMFPLTQIFQSSVNSAINLGRADIIQKRGYKAKTAGFLSSGSTCIRILLSPLVGFFVDRFGKRFHLVAVAPICWILCGSLLVFSDVHPMVALVFQSIAQVFNAPPIQLALHLLIGDHRLVGSGFGVYRSFNNAGSLIMDVVLGKVQDDTPNQGYDRVVAVLFGFKAYMFLFALGYIFVDYKYLGGGLTMRRAKRDAIEASIPAEERPFNNLTSKKKNYRWLTIFGLGVLVSMGITGWVVFFLGLTS